MGKNNRQRRADKHRQRKRQGPRSQGRGFSIDPRDMADALVYMAAEATQHADESDDVEEFLDRLVALDTIAATALTGAIVRQLRAAWEGGWQPVDIARATAKQLAATHVGLVAEMISLDAASGAGSRGGMPDDWSAQLTDLVRPVRSDGQRWPDKEALRAGVEILGLLLYLPVIPCLLPPPSQWGSRRRPERAASPGVDSRMLDKVAALLAKAESTEFDQEAEALTAKAQELMARYAIDHAMLTDAAGGEEPRGRRVGVEDPYAQGKANLLAAIASANRCRTVWMQAYGFSTVFGFPGDVEIVEILYLSLLVQATRAMTASGAVRDSSGRSRTRSFRQSFLLSFASRIGERLRSATRAATDDAGEVHGSSLLPVLASRSAVVEEAFDALFPHLVATSARISNVAGWAAGRAAADQAHLRPEQQTLPAFAG